MTKVVGIVEIRNEENYLFKLLVALIWLKKKNPNRCIFDSVGALYYLTWSLFGRMETKQGPYLAQEMMRK